MLNERELTERIFRGDMRSFKELVERYENLVFCIIRRLILKEEDVEDICQEVFIKVYQNLSKFNFQAKLSTWIAQIAYNTSINYVRKQQREFERMSPMPLPDVYFSTDDPDFQLNKMDVASYLGKLIGELPEQYRIVLSLYHLKEFSYQEIETITGMPDGTVKSYLFRARKILKEKLEQYLKNENA